MSRCFPYPPPGYERNGIRDEALFESIKSANQKRQIEGEKAKKDNKKEKKRKRKEKDNTRENGEAGKEKHRRKKRHKDEKSLDGKKGRDHDKNRKLETENLEKSNLTEEHGQPVGSQNSCDSTFNSNRRHKPTSPPESCHNPGNIIRIRLPLQGHKDSEISPSKEQPCSASGGTHNAFAHGPCEPASRQGKEQVDHHPCSTSNRDASQVVENCSLHKVKHYPTTKSFELSHKTQSISMPSTSTSCLPPLPPIVSQFRDLFENWVPPPLQDEVSGDESWLFESKQSHNNGVERCKDESDMLIHEPLTPWPRAHFLPSADIFAFPYAALF